MSLGGLGPLLSLLNRRQVVRNGSHDLPRWNKIIDLLIYTKWDNSVQQSHDSKKQCLWLQVLRCSWFLCVIPWTFCLVICSAVDADLTKQGDVEYLNCYSRIYLASLRTRMASVTLVSRIWRCMLSCRNPQRSVCHRRQIIHSGTQESNSIAPQVQQQPHGRRPVGTDESGNTLGSTDGVNFEVSSCNSSQKKSMPPQALSNDKKRCAGSQPQKGMWDIANFTIHPWAIQSLEKHMYFPDWLWR